ncbi:hypothetical protein H8E88_02840 [candidate division KSB1 bacterium]|nr:hypothetical protein [candidate division KSB1 bacterium]MBL7095661.1 hypothetical protein [candidate division KSB1 bacterium]
MNNFCANFSGCWMLEAGYWTSPSGTWFPAMSIGVMEYWSVEVMEYWIVQG